MTRLECPHCAWFIAYQVADAERVLSRHIEMVHTEASDRSADAASIALLERLPVHSTVEKLAAGWELQMYPDARAQDLRLRRDATYHGVTLLDALRRWEEAES